MTIHVYGVNVSGKAIMGQLITDPTDVTLLRVLNNPNSYGTSSFDYFGHSVAISGDRAIVGAWGEDDAAGQVSGKAYIFDVTTGVKLWTLDNPGTYGSNLSDEFGKSVAISGNYATVSASMEDDIGGDSSGKIYVFNVTSGELFRSINNPNVFGTSANDNFGSSVAISGNYLIAGAPGEDAAGEDAAGKVYVFDIITGGLLHTFSNPTAYGTSFNDGFGYSVAVDGNRVIIGAHQEDDASGLNGGKAYIYDITTGSLLFTLNNPNPYGTSANDHFGYSVAISGDRAIVGAHFEDEPGTYGDNRGKAYIFNMVTGELVYTLNNPNAYSSDQNFPDTFGHSVAISGNYAIVGALLADTNGTNSGTAHIFNVTSGALLGTLDNPNVYGSGLSDYFGGSTSISGNYIIVGVYGEDNATGTDSGTAYIYKLV